MGRRAQAFGHLVWSWGFKFCFDQPLAPFLMQAIAGDENANAIVVHDIPTECQLLAWSPSPHFFSDILSGIPSGSSSEVSEFECQGLVFALCGRSSVLHLALLTDYMRKDQQGRRQTRMPNDGNSGGKHRTWQLSNADLSVMFKRFKMNKSRSATEGDQ